MKEEKNIDDLFRSSFEDFEVAPPAAVKEAIDRTIDGRPSRRNTWWLFLLLLLVGSGVFAYVYTTSSASDGPSQTAGTPAGISSTQSTSAPASNGATSGSSAPGTRTAAGSTSGVSAVSDGNTIDRTASARRSSGANGTGDATTALSERKGKTITGNQASGQKKRSGGKKKSGGGKKSGRSTAGTRGTSNGGLSGQKSNGTGGNTPPEEPKSNIPPVAGANEGNGTDPSTPPATPTDSVPPVKEDPPKKEEKLADSTTDPATQKPEKKTDREGEQWRASVYLGPQLAWGKTTPPSDQQRLSGGSSHFQFSGELNRSLFAGYGLSTGLQYGTKRPETFAWDTYTITDSTVSLEWEYIYGNPNFPDSITDSVQVEVWSYDSTGTTGMQVNSISSFGIPLYITKAFAFGERWSLLVNAGAQFNFYTVKLGTADSLPITQTVNKFGTTLIGRAHVAYNWNQWQFSAGLNAGYDLKLPIVYEGIDRRRYFVTPQIAVHFVF